jgi:hypothetical protein
MPWAEAGRPQTPKTSRTESPIRRLMIASAPFALRPVVPFAPELPPFKFRFGDVLRQWYKRLHTVLCASTFSSSTFLPCRDTASNPFWISRVRRIATLAGRKLNQRQDDLAPTR